MHPFRITGVRSFGAQPLSFSAQEGVRAIVASKVRVLGRPGPWERFVRRILLIQIRCAVSFQIQSGRAGPCPGPLNFQRAF